MDGRAEDLRDAFPTPHTLQTFVRMLEELCSRNHGTKVSVGDVIQMLGVRSFAPVILAVGLIAITPIDSIPTFPTTFGIVVFLTSGQMLIGRRSLWLPNFIARRAVQADRLLKALRWLEPYAEKADGWVGMRLTAFTQGPFLIAIAICCAFLAALMPVLELLPLVSTVPALAFAAFGVALLMHDGLAAILGFAFTAATLGLVAGLAKLPF
jgi:hypothetical protein